MAAKVMKSTFISGLHYLNHQQYLGGNLGGMQMINRRLEFSKNLYSKDLYAHYGCVNAVEFSNDGEWLVSGGDDKRVLIWNVDKALSNKYNPKTMKGEHNSNIFCLGFNPSLTKLFSGGNDEQVILHDVNTAETLDVFLHDDAVYGLSIDPVNENIFVSACDDGRILMWDIRQPPNDPIILANCSSPYHSVMYNPVATQFIATGNAKEGVCLWDMRKPRVPAVKYGPSKGAMSVRFNSTGTQLLALRRRLPPILYDITNGHSAAEFDHSEYYNSCTMKSCCFAGDRDQYILSGSDDFKLYVWKVPENLSSKKRIGVSKAHFVLRGHRSIVNQVRYNNSYGILASSGVEKIIKLWSSFPISHTEVTVNGYVTSKDLNRKVYSHEEYITIVLESGQFMTHDYSHCNVQEDPRMMAFFDSLVQRDIEGWTSDSNNTEIVPASCYEVQTTDSPISSSSSSSSTDSDDDIHSMHEPFISTRIINGTLNHFLQPVPLPVSVADGKTGGEEKDDCSIDRISHLIAEKRRESKLKTGRFTYSERDLRMIRKKMKRIKKKGESKRKYGASRSHQNGSHSNQGNGTKTGSSKSANVKDKRKLLRKKRAKLSKEAVFSNSLSSDSDTNDQKLESISKSQNGNKSTEDNSVETVENNSERNVAESNNAANHKDHTEADTILPNASSNGLNGTATNSDSLVCFAPKNGKHNKRNYRKRSAEEMDDE